MGCVKKNEPSNGLLPILELEQSPIHARLLFIGLADGGILWMRKKINPEYICFKLDSPLVAGKEYAISFTYRSGNTIDKFDPEFFTFNRPVVSDLVIDSVGKLGKLKPIDHLKWYISVLI